MAKDVSFRLYRPEDLHLVRNSFLRTFRRSPVTRLIGTDVYDSVYLPVINEFIGSPDINLCLAVNPEDHDRIFSWCAFQKLGGVQILHYAYTKSPFRGFSLPKKTLEHFGFNLEEPFFYTLLSADALKLRKKYPHAVYNPYLLFQPVHPGTDSLLEPTP